MNPNAFTLVEGLEKDLRGREPGARAQHRALNKRVSNASPERERGDRRKSSPPSKPCNLCGTYHWRTGTNATPCPTTRASSVPKEKVQLKKEVYVVEDKEETTGEDTSDTVNVVSNNETKLDDQSFYDAENYLVDWEDHGKLIDYDSANYTGIYLVEGKEKRGPTQKHNTVIRAKALGPVPNEHTYKRFESQKILVRNGDQFGEPRFRPIDPGSAMSFVSEKFLN